MHGKIVEKRGIKFMKKKVLITGITGFVGSHLAEFLIKKKNIKIYGIKRWHLSNLKNIKHILNKVVLFDCDITDGISVDNLLKKINLILFFIVQLKVLSVLLGTIQIDTCR